ncbi:MAG: RluA family pseudouridine synthase [Alphaproteobacteria bacterium]|nr:RluA family pseudouridine synthase [Alphaproteobacteria bacterium]MBQ6012162.1 RluA family pseudouridine synthase [Alphaproteobacteria bacterium]
MADIRKFIVDAENIGIRIDKFLSVQMPEFSRSEIQKFNIKRPDGGMLKLSDKTKAGEEFIVEIVEKKSDIAYENISNDFELDILFEDDDIIVIDKPRGVVMYPSAGNKTGTMVQNLLSYTHLSVLGGQTRPGVVHRLDKDTSGVMVFAKSDAAYRGLVKMFSTHDLTRKYIVFVWGVPTWGGAEITGNIARSSRNRQKMSMVKTGGKPAHTIVNVMDVWTKSNISLFRCTLMTGRTHQIRVHLSSHGFPVLCDPLYGREKSHIGSVKNPELLRFLREHNGQMLHAEVLEFIHPITGEKMHFKSRMPVDMMELKEILDSTE